jgi:hypothetical protein
MSEFGAKIGQRQGYREKQKTNKQHIPVDMIHQE